MHLSIVSTLYQSEPYLNEFLQRMATSAQQITQDYELILVNDGSPDGSLQKALLAQQQDAHIKIIDLSRNFGHHEAGMIGLEHAQGEFIFLIDSDLEEAPELLLQFWQAMQQQPDSDVIYGVQAQRKGRWFEQNSGQLFYTLFNALSEIKIPANALTIRLMRKPFVDSLAAYRERKLFVAGIMAHAGFNQQAMLVNKLSKSTTTYTLAKQLQLVMVSITSFSSKPLTYLFVFGCLLLLLAVFSLLTIGINAVLFNAVVTNMTVMLLATALISGCVITCTGLLGLYIANLQAEIKQRPRVIIKRIY
ncbi:MAG: glycosyltransferase family 2 protein [Methylococcaceae bacterium]|nr:glycosyltransferase family 2 protein [Methylococcaceae bacterium]